jgi:hypothetical protein
VRLRATSRAAARLRAAAFVRTRNHAFAKDSLMHLPLSSLALLSFALSPLAGCTTPVDEPASTTTDTITKSERQLSCNLEYETFTPAFATAAAAQFSQPLADVRARGASASDGTLAMTVSIDASPASNLSFTVAIATVADARGLAYVVLPAPKLGGDYLFELGAALDPLLAATIGFDHARAYCTLTAGR